MAPTLGFLALVGIGLLFSAALLVKSMLPLTRRSLFSSKALLAASWVAIGTLLIYSAAVTWRYGIF